MNGVLIDDKRIKVDFSQSVSKYWINFKKNSKFDNNPEINTNQGNDLTLINENVKLEIKNKNNFQIGNKDKNNNQYKYVFNRDNNDDKYDKKERKKERSRDKNYNSNKQYYHSSHNHKYKH